MGPLMSAYLLTGYLQPRAGSAIPYSVPRGTFRCQDGTWVAISTSADTVAARVMTLLGLNDDPRFNTFAGRVEHRDELDAAVASWIGARPVHEVLAAFEAAEAAIAPVMTMADIAADPHFRHRGAVVDIDGTPMQGLIARLSATPGRLRWTGRAVDADGAEIRKEVGD
jgi:crotonobetainyl-CoA:carnitine CoA-transferase CaiB-like acyl-CoA transferase